MNLYIIYFKVLITMIYNQYKYELLSIINMELDKKNYDDKIVKFLLSFSAFIKELK